MKRYINLSIILFFLAFLSSCKEKKNEEAILYLSNIETLYKNGEYENALNKVDSIQRLYPKAYEEIKAGLTLKQDIRKALNKEQIRVCDSLLSIYVHKIDSIMEVFVYQKDKEDTKGIFIPKTVSNSIATTTLRAGVNEDGTMYIESVYLGGQQHNKLGVISKDKQSTETLPVNDDGLNFRFSNLGQQYEIIKITPIHDNGLSEFIFKNTDQPLTVQLKGKNTTSYSLSNVQKKAITDSYLLSSWITERDSLLMAKGKALTLINYLDSKKEEQPVEEKN